MADRLAQPALDPIDQAHLTGTSRPSPPIHRYPPSPALVELIERYWIPVWSTPSPLQQRTLQHPICLLVISNTYARFYGPTRGLSTVTLDGEGWAVGTMFMPAAGHLVWGQSVAGVADRFVDLDDVPAIDASALVPQVHAAMGDDPTSPDAHRVAIAAVEEQLVQFVPVDAQGTLVNAVVAYLRDHPELTRVSELATAFAMSERSLHRLVGQRLGLTPKWLIQRRRLHDAVAELKAGERPLAAIAAELGYTDQAHFTQDFKAVTGLTPGAYLADQP